MSAFKWTRKREKAALILAQGYTQREAAEQAKVTERTIRRWYNNLEFAMEVDRLTLLTGISTRAERMRIVMQVVRQRILEKDGRELVLTKKDILEWLKLAQSETDGAKLDLAPVFEALAAQAESNNTDDGDASSLDAEPGASDGSVMHHSV